MQGARAGIVPFSVLSAALARHKADLSQNCRTFWVEKFCASRSVSPLDGRFCHSAFSKGLRHATNSRIDLLYGTVLLYCTEGGRNPHSPFESIHQSINPSSIHQSVNPQGLEGVGVEVKEGARQGAAGGHAAGGGAERRQGSQDVPLRRVSVRQGR